MNETYNAEALARWLEDPNFQDFLRRVHLDIHVGLKYGANVNEVRSTLNELAKFIQESVEFNLLSPKDNIFKK